MSRPACYGSPVAVSQGCETCQGCQVRLGCADAALRLVEGMPDSPLLQRERQRLSLARQALGGAPRAEGAGEGARARTRVGLTPEQQRAVASLGKAAGSLARQLFERGWFEFARRELAAGRNPGRNDWQRILCAGLMKGGISRQQLQLAYQEQLELTPGSARVRVSKAVSVFLAGRLVVEVEGRLQINPN